MDEDFAYEKTLCRINSPLQNYLSCGAQITLGHKTANLSTNIWSLHLPLQNTFEKFLGSSGLLCSRCSRDKKKKLAAV